MQGDFSVLNFDPRRDDRAVATPADGVLRNVNGVLHQQGRVTLDVDHTDGGLLELDWNRQAGRDIVGAGVCAVPPDAPQSFHVDAAFVQADGVHVLLRPGRAWADGILTRLAGLAPDPAAAVERLAAWYGPPAPVDDGLRDAVILEVSEEALHALQYPARLLEPALGGPDTSCRAYVNARVRLLRLADGEDCRTIAARLRDDPADRGRLTVSLAPVVAIAGDCPVAGGGGYTGFEHCLYRIEVADTPPAAPPRFKWSQWNGGLVGRGRFDATTVPARVVIDAGRPAIIHSGLSAFYLEALQYDTLLGGWRVVYGTTATLDTDHDLELAAPASFGALPATTEPVFFRLWNGIADVADFTDGVDPVELRDGIRLAFDAPAADNYRPGDYWMFTVRAGDIANAQVLVDAAPPLGIVHYRVPLAEIAWTGRHDTRISGTIEDCRVPLPPLTSRRGCCTWQVGDGITSFGDFNSLEQAADHLPPGGGELCLLPGVHRTNLRLEGRRNVRIHGCARRSLLLPGPNGGNSPVLHIVDCDGIQLCDFDLVTFDGAGVQIEGTKPGSCRDVRIHTTRMVARTSAIVAANAADLAIADNRLHLLDTPDGLATIASAADDVLIERNTLVLLPFRERPPEQPSPPDDDPTRDPADPCARPHILYRFPARVREYALLAWAVAPAQVEPAGPYRAIGGIHVLPGSERVRILENRIVGGSGNGITLGGDLVPAQPPAPPDAPRVAGRVEPDVAVTVADSGHLLALVQDETGKALPGVDVSLDAETGAADRTDEHGMASLKAAPGHYRLRVAPQYRVARVTEARYQGMLVAAVTVAAAARAATRGFLYDIAIEGNEVSLMGLSGIGFGLRTGIDLKGAPPAPAAGPMQSPVDQIDTALFALALPALLRATDPVRGLAILGNRLRLNLRNPFSREMQAAAQVIGRGGVSLAVVDGAIVRSNDIAGNGTGAADPVCGVFVGYGDDLAIDDNTVSDNGPATGFDTLNPGLRGGIYVRFAAALTESLSRSTGHRPALRVHANRVDQPAGRALTAFTFGPVSVTGNHLNSEYTGLFGELDSGVGGTLLYNFGGIHRLIARQQAGMLGHAAGLAAQVVQVLPGGETLFNDNFQRVGTVNRSNVAQSLITFDDLGYASNTSSVYRTDTLLANALLAGDCVRATASRFREDVAHTFSLVTRAARANMTALNQADHCIAALPPHVAGRQLPTVDQPNQVLDAEYCAKVQGQPNALAQHFAAGRATTTEPADATTFLTARARQGAARALGLINAGEIELAHAYAAEAARMADKHGAGSPLVAPLAARATAGARISSVLVPVAETLQVPVPPAGPEQASVAGRLVNDRGQGLAGYTIELHDARGQRVERVGGTGAAGEFAVSYDGGQAAALHKRGKLYAWVLDRDGKDVLHGQQPLDVAPGAHLQLALVLPVAVIPKSVVASGTVVYPASAGGTGKPPARPG